MLLKKFNCSYVRLECLTENFVVFRPLVVLAFLWQIVKLQYLNKIGTKCNPGLKFLLNKGETMSTFSKLNSDLLIIRWVNHHISKSKRSSRVMTNFGSDLKVIALSLSCYSFGHFLSAAIIFACLCFWSGFRNL